MARVHTVNQPRRFRARAVNYDRTPATGTRVRYTNINQWRPTATCDPVAKRTTLRQGKQITAPITEVRNPPQQSSDLYHSSLINTDGSSEHTTEQHHVVGTRSYGSAG